tara:strand:- start:125 stop:871 length:747 start_codon:yes stop_codon:yes gene_type:complete
MKINKIYNEDCLKTMSKMPDNYIDVSITSPPYNIGQGRKNGQSKKILKYDSYNDNLKKIDYFNKTKVWIDELYRVTKHHIFYNIQEIKGNRGIINFLYQEYNDKIKEVFIWAKRNPPSNINDKGVSRGYEFIFCISKDRPDVSVFSHCNFSNYNGDYVKNILIKSVNTDQETKQHNFAFPLWLPRYFINYFSKNNDLIYDPFMGVGTTACASLDLDRNFIGSEISEQYTKIGNKRLLKYKNQMQLFKN